MTTILYKYIPPKSLGIYSDYDFELHYSEITIPISIIIGLLECSLLDAIKYKWGSQESRNNLKALLCQYNSIAHKYFQCDENEILLEADEILNNELFSILHIILDNNLYRELRCLNCNNTYSPMDVKKEDFSKTSVNTLYLFDKYTCKNGHAFHGISREHMHLS